MSLSPEERLRRGRIVRKHVIAALVTLLVIIPVNFIVSPRNPWWIWVLVVWLPLVALHTAWAMGLFDRDGKEL